jgi:hypothetical protein
MNAQRSQPLTHALNVVITLLTMLRGCVILANVKGIESNNEVLEIKKLNIFFQCIREAYRKKRCLNASSVITASLTVLLSVLLMFVICARNIHTINTA